MTKRIQRTGTINMADETEFETRVDCAKIEAAVRDILEACLLYTSDAADE